MSIISIPTIVVISYLITEVFKLFLKNHKKYLPVIAGCSGAIIALIMYLITPSLLNNVDVFTALALGIVSGLSATGSNQVLKQLLRKEE